MTKEQFDNYSFSIYTLIKTNKTEGWENISEVNFAKRYVMTNFYGLVNFNEIEEIRH